VPSPDAAMILYTYRSHPLSDIVRPLLKESINLYAEAVQRLNASGPPPRTNDQALDGLKQRLVSWGIAAEGFQLVDGSGLSRRDVVAPDTLLTILARMYDPSGTSPWMTALPIAGVDGTLAGRMKGTPGENNVRAKTGTMSNVRSLAGYVTTRDGEPLAFVAMVDNFEGTGAQANAALDALAVCLASFSRSAAEDPPLRRFVEADPPCDPATIRLTLPPSGGLSDAQNRKHPWTRRSRGRPVQPGAARAGAAAGTGRGRRARFQGGSVLAEVAAQQVGHAAGDGHRHRSEQRPRLVPEPRSGRQSGRDRWGEWPSRLLHPGSGADRARSGRQRRPRVGRKGQDREVAHGPADRDRRLERICVGRRHRGTGQHPEVHEGRKAGVGLRPSPAGGRQGLQRDQPDDRR